MPWRLYTVAYCQSGTGGGMKGGNVTLESRPEDTNVRCRNDKAQMTRTINSTAYRRQHVTWTAVKHSISICKYFTAAEFSRITLCVGLYTCFARDRIVHFVHYFSKNTYCILTVFHLLFLLPQRSIVAAQMHIDLPAHWRASTCESFMPAGQAQRAVVAEFIRHTSLQLTAVHSRSLSAHITSVACYHYYRCSQ